MFNKSTVLMKFWVQTSRISKIMHDASLMPVTCECYGRPTCPPTGRKSWIRAQISAGYITPEPTGYQPRKYYSSSYRVPDSPAWSSWSSSPGWVHDREVSCWDLRTDSRFAPGRVAGWPTIVENSWINQICLLHVLALKRGSVPPWCTLGSAILVQFFLRNGSN